MKQTSNSSHEGGRPQGDIPGHSGSATKARSEPTRFTSAAFTAAVLAVGIAAFAASVDPAFGAPAQPHRWRAPVGPPLRISAGYNAPAHDWLPGHRGVDLRTDPGTKVHAADSGSVKFVGRIAGRYVVVINHGDLRTTYEPVKSELLVGEHVGAGQVIGEIATGSGHCGDGRCLHFGVRRGAAYLDPMFLLAGFESVLRPL